jgi:signal transduction histidine kinase
MMKVLLVEPNPEEVRRLAEGLGQAAQRPFVLEPCAGIEPALAALGQGDFDLILLDLDVPGSPPLETLAKAQEHVANRLPIVVLLRPEDETMGIEAVRRGAQDFFLKSGLAPRLLAHALLCAVERHRAHQARVGREIPPRRLAETLSEAQRLEAFGQLAGGAAHDFNNLLAIIRANAELVLLSGAELGAEAAEGIHHIIGATERGAALTRQLLIFGRKQAMQPQPVRINESIENLSRMLKRVIRENIQLECRYAGDLPMVQADPGVLDHVLINLVVNAQDAMAQGGRLWISTDKVVLEESQVPARSEARAGEFACLTVADTGTGIAPEQLPHIFEPFFTTKEPGKGTGLGLAIVYGAIKQHRGWVEVSSQLGQGTTFRIFLPALPPPLRREASEPAPGRPPGGTETILLVEDDLPVRLVTRKVLEKFHYRVYEAAGAREALELWRQHAPEIALLLTDVVLPDAINGRELAERLHTEKPGLKILFFSGYSAAVLSGNAEFIRQARSLQKPCSPSTLLQAVRDCLDAR